MRTRRRRAWAWAWACQRQSWGNVTAVGHDDRQLGGLGIPMLPLRKEFHLSQSEVSDGAMEPWAGLGLRRSSSPCRCLSQMTRGARREALVKDVKGLGHQKIVLPNWPLVYEIDWRWLAGQSQRRDEKPHFLAVDGCVVFTGSGVDIRTLTWSKQRNKKKNTK